MAHALNCLVLKPFALWLKLPLSRTESQMNANTCTYAHTHSQTHACKLFADIHNVCACVRLCVCVCTLRHTKACPTGAWAYWVNQADSQLAHTHTHSELPEPDANFLHAWETHFQHTNTDTHTDTWTHRLSQGVVCSIALSCDEGKRTWAIIEIIIKPNQISCQKSLLFSPLGFWWGNCDVCHPLAEGARWGMMC